MSQITLINLYCCLLRLMNQFTL